MAEKPYNNYVRRFIWSMLTNLAKKRKVCFYGDVVDAVRKELGIRLPNEIGYMLAPIMYFCKRNGLPHLTTLVVSKKDGLPGEGFTGAEIYDMDDLKDVNELVFNYNWSWLRNPFAGFDTKNTTIESFADKIIANPKSAKKVYRKVLDRGQSQKIFRQALLRAYNYRCAVCGYKFKKTLQAAHIYPWSKASDEDKINVCNGILLCPNHHALYDGKLLTISKNYIIEYKNYKGRKDEIDNDVLIKFAGKKMYLPKEKKLWPSPQLLKKHCSDDDDEMKK